MLAAGDPRVAAVVEMIQPAPQLWRGSGGTGKGGRARRLRVAPQLLMEEFSGEEGLTVRVIAREPDLGV